MQDITDRVKVEENLTRLAERHNLAIHSSGIGIWDWDILKNELIWDEQMVALYGLQPGNFKGAYEAWLNGVHPDDREESDKISQSAVRGEREYDTEFRVLWPDGSVHWLKADGRVFRDENGTATRMVGVNYDITERKESENKLREQRALLKQVLDSEPDAIFAIDLNYYLLVNNRRHQQVLVDTGGHQLQPGESILPSDYQPEIIDYWRGLYNRAFDGEEFKTEMEWPYSDGQMHSIETNLSPLRNSDSEIVGALAVIRDTTEHKISDKKRKESEERYQKLAENFPDTTIAFYNNELKVTFVTGQELIKSGKTASDYIGKRFDEILIPSLATVAEKSFKKAFKGEIDTFEGKSFDERFIRVIAVPIVESDGTVNEIQVISQNITERKKAEYNRLISERKYSLLFDKSGTPTIVFKFPGGIISEANEKVEELTGYSRDEMIGKTSVEVGFVEYENRAKVLAILMRNEPVFGFELHILAKNGESRTVLVNAVHFYNEETHYIISTWVDITDRKRADQKLLESEERSKAMLRAIPDLLFRVDRNGKFLDYKADVKDLYAQSVSLIGLRNRDVTPPEFADLIERKIEETLSSGQIQTFEYQMLIPGTGLQEFEARMAPSGPDEVISIVRNITEQKKAERQLRESEQRFATIFKDSPVAIAISRVSDGKIIHINSSFTNLLGLTPEEVLGKTTLELGIWAIPADRLRFIEILSKNQQVVGMETLLGLKSGENRQVQVWGDLINLNGEPCMLAEVIDITDKKNQEQEIRSQNEKLHAILNSLPDKLFIHDSDGYFLEAYTTDPEGFIIPVENILGSTLFDIFPKDVAELNLKYLKECITNKELITHEFSTDYKGKFMHFEVRVVPFMQDKVIRFVRDITRKKEIEKEILELNNNLEHKIQERTSQLLLINDELIKAKEIAEQANKAKSAFLANMSHEIRTPLNSIIGFSELLYNSLNNDKKRSQVESIRKSGLSLLNIINDILDLSKVEAGKIVIDNEPLNVFKIVGDVGRMFEIKVAEKKLDLIIELETNLSRPLLLDETRLRQILFNLIGNAVKFTNEGGVTVFIHHQEKDKEHVDLEIRIADTGIGIPEDQLKLIFEPFVQQQGQTQKSFGGTGLGLAISQRMAEAMGGEIRINSKVNVGSEFILSLKNVAYATSYSEEEEAGPAAYANIRFDGRTILIVDDVADNRDLLLDVLEMTGARLLEAQNGAEAVRIATAELPDIILMDIRMPVMDGLEACKALKQSPATAGIQCIAVSASIKLGQSQNEVPENFEESLMKPLAFDQLFEVLKKYLGHAFKSDSAITNAPNTTVVQEEEWSDDLQQYIVEKVMPLYEHIMRTQLVDEMEEFGKLLVYAGDRYNDNILMTTGRKIKDYTDLFDVEKLTKTMHEFQFVLNRKLK